MIRVVIDTNLDFLPIQTWSCFGYILHSLTFLELFLCTSCDLQIQYCLKNHVNVPRSITMVRQTTTRTLEVHCQMFVALLSKHRCMDNIMNSLAPLSKWWCTCCSDMYIMLYCSLGKVTVLNFVFEHIFLFVVLFNLSCDLYDLSNNSSLLM